METRTDGTRTRSGCARLVRAARQNAGQCGQHARAPFSVFAFQGWLSSVWMFIRAMEPEAPVYERIVLKLSGEAMQQHGGRDNISPPVVREIAERMKEVRDLAWKWP